MLNLESGGFKEAGTLKIKDVSGASLSLDYKLALCGDNFYEKSVCTRPIPVDEEEGPAINFAPRLDPEPSDISIDDLWETYD